ncbi:hypothetical protein [Burkholderia sp. Ac-20365]|uniref:hypothetical protein n=1 Tax=Burkholderia sp. Ac-20365 TaxID=2703897 RepID=UPI00197B741C|nr:hypothetical protein [Burkholderia sp. Ac-20365]MBN3764683.1 hypothetical protein [Burkholderia sp. Ac-20365]
MSLQKFSPAIVSIQPKRAVKPTICASTQRGRIVWFVKVVVASVVLSLALSGCGVFCNIGGGSGGIGGNCDVGTGFRF